MNDPVEVFITLALQDYMIVFFAQTVLLLGNNLILKSSCYIRILFFYTLIQMVEI